MVRQKYWPELVEVYIKILLRLPFNVTLLIKEIALISATLELFEKFKGINWATIYACHSILCILLSLIEWADVYTRADSLQPRHTVGTTFIFTSPATELLVPFCFEQFLASAMAGQGPSEPALFTELEASVSMAWSVPSVWFLACFSLGSVNFLSGGSCELVCRSFSLWLCGLRVGSVEEVIFNFGWRFGVANDIMDCVFVSL